MNANPFQQTLYARASQIQRRAYDKAQSDFHANKIHTGQLAEREAKALGYTVSDQAMDDDCDSPAYTLMTWARNAINGRNYRRRGGPDVRFAFRMESGLILEVLPQYIGTAEYIERLEVDDPAGLAASNWQFDHEYELRVYEQAASRVPRYRGWFDSEIDPVMTNAQQEVTDDALETLWRVHRNRDSAFAGMPICGCCRRVLTDDISRKLGIGPDCASRIGIGHGIGTARAIELKRRSAA